MLHWRRNTDEGLRRAERTARGGGVHALATLYRARMRAGDLHPADLWLAARIPPYNTCFEEVHAAAELAFGEPIPRSAAPEDVENDRGAFGFALMDLFYYDLADESDAGQKIPAERLIRRALAMDWFLRGLKQQTRFSPESLPEVARSLAENMAYWPAGSSSRLHSYWSLVSRSSRYIDWVMNSRQDPLGFWEKSMGLLQRHLLRSSS